MGRSFSKKIIVFGASGKTGCQITRYALEKGHHVTAFVRDKSKIKLKYNNLKIIKGNVLNPKDTDKAIKDQDIVISTIGVKPGQTPVCKAGIENIIASMKKNKVKKLVTISAYGARDSKIGFYSKLLHIVLKKIMEDKEAMEELIEKSNLDWLIIRPPILTNGKFADQYTAGSDISLSGFHFISREDVARFLVNALESKNYQRKIIVLHN